MKAAIVRGNCDIAILEAAEPRLQKPTEIKIRVSTAAICNTTDNKVYATDTPEANWPNDSFPFILGHECTGQVVEKGDSVTDFDVGDRIVYWTVNGKAFADYLIIDTAASAVDKIPDSVPEDVAAISEMPIGAGRILFNEDGSPRVKPGDAVAVVGLGPAGLIYEWLVRRLGAGKVCAAGRRALRLETALKMGADAAVDTTRPGWHDQVIEALGKKPDVLIDATGGDIVADILPLATPATTIVAYGVPDFNWADRRAELTEAGLTAPLQDGNAQASVEHCVQWFASDWQSLQPVITHRLAFDEVGKGLDLCRLERDTTLKVVLHVNDQ